MAGPEETIQRALSGITGVRHVSSLGIKENGSFDFQIEAEEGKDVRRPLFNLLADRRWPILSLDSGEMTLEDIFLKLTSEDIVERTIRKRKKEAQKHSQENKSKYKPMVDKNTANEEDAAID